MIPLLIGAAAAAAGMAIASSSDDEESTSQSESKSVKAVDESRVPAHIRAKANMKSQNNVQSDKSAIDACMNEIRREIDSRGSRGIGYYGGTVKLRYINESKFKLSYELYFSDDDLSKSYTFDFDQLPPDARRQLRNEKIVSFDLNDNQDQSQDLATIRRQGGISGSTAVVQNQSLIPRWARSRLMTTDGQLVIYIKGLSNAELDELINSGAI